MSNFKSFEKTIKDRAPMLVAVTVSLAAIVALGFMVGSFIDGNRRAEPAPTVTITATPEPTVTPTPVETLEPAPEEPSGVSYASCEEVWQALGRPIFAEDEGYSLKHDWDSDGVGCEDNPLTTDVDESETDWPAVRNRFKNNLQELGDAVVPKAEEFGSQVKEFFSN